MILNQWDLKSLTSQAIPTTLWVPQWTSEDRNGGSEFEALHWGGGTGAARSLQLAQALGGANGDQ